MFKIGEFARIAQLPTSQLRYYDEVNLLKPAHIDPWSSYRYYTVEQLPTVHRILALRDLGLTLQQIRQLMQEDISVEEIRGMFTLRKTQIEQTLQAEIGRLRTVEARLNQLEASGNSADFDIVLKDIPAQPYIGLRTQLPSIFDSFDIAQKLLQQLPKALGKNKLGNITVLFHSDFGLETDIDVTIGMTLEKPTDKQVALTAVLHAEPRWLPSLPLVATAMRHGDHTNNIHAMDSLGQWAAANQFTLLENGRERVINPPRSKFNRQEMVVEIQVPVQKRVDAR